MSSSIMVSRVEGGWTWAVINAAGETTACGAAPDQDYALAAARRVSRLAEAASGDDEAASPGAGQCGR